MRPKGSAEALEMRRMIGGRILREGRDVREVSRLTGAFPSTVSRWKKELEEGGGRPCAPGPIQAVRPGSPRYVWHILTGMGWSAQKPERRARERDEEAIAAWRAEGWGKVKKSPATTAGRSC